jgi:hypothetical protein
LAKERDTNLVRGEQLAHKIIRGPFFQETKKSFEKRSSGYFKTLEADPGAGRRGTGQIAGLIHKIRPEADLIEEMIRDAKGMFPGTGENLPGQ